MTKVMLVEDEPHIRKILQTVIERNGAFEVVCSCDNMTDALLLFHTHQPEVVFMDIEINGSSGMDCARVIMDMEPRTKIIFATAHAEYMSNAFEIYAFDYLVKPFDIERVEHTLERIRKQNTLETVSFTEETGTDSSRAKLMIKGKESISFVDTQDIVLVERESNTTHIYTDSGEEYCTSASMADLENRLDTQHFMRSHKSYIINLSKIKKIEPYGRWTYVVRFGNLEKDALLTREKYEQIKKMYE